MSKVLKVGIAIVIIQNFLFFVVRQLSHTSLIFDQTLVIAVGVSAFLLIFQKSISKSKQEILIYILVVFCIASTQQFVFLNIDRSRSYFLLSWISNGEISYNQTNQIVSIVKSPEAEATAGILMRVEEQSARGLIVRKNNKLALTHFGEVVLQTSNLLSHLFHLTGWSKNAR